MTNLPAYLNRLPVRNLAQVALANVGSGTPPYVSIAGGRFTLIDIAGNQMQVPAFNLDVVIVDINEHISKIFFGADKPYDPNNPTPPLCFSDNGIAPSSAVAPRPECGPTCAVCAQNVWGSKISQMGSAVKQCADQQKIAVVAPDYSSGIFLLRIPPGSFIHWRGYMAKFQSSGIDPSAVLTRLEFEQGAVGTLKFSSPGYVPEQVFTGLVLPMLESKAADPIIGRLDQPRTAALPAPATASIVVAPNVATVNPGQWPANPDGSPAYTTQPQVQQPGPFAGQVAQPAPKPPLTSAPTQTGQPSPAAYGMPAQGAAPGQATEPPKQRRQRRTAQPPAAPPQREFPAQAASQTAPFRTQPEQGSFPLGDAQAGPMPGSGPGVASPQFGIAPNAPPAPAGLDLDAVFGK